MQYWDLEPRGREYALWERTEGDFDLLDPCSCSETGAASVGGHSISRATRRFWKGNCGISADHDWKADAVFVNPPSSFQQEFCKKFVSEVEKGHFRFGIMLLPVYTAANWLAKIMEHPGVVSHILLQRQRFIRGEGALDSGTKSGVDPHARLLLFVDRKFCDLKGGVMSESTLQLRAAAAQHFFCFFKKFSSGNNMVLVHVPI